jgi:hypothetical protein
MAVDKKHRTPQLPFLKETAVPMESRNAAKLFES